MSDILEQIAESLYNGDAGMVAELTRQALDAGHLPEKVLSGGLVNGMDAVGRDFKAGDLFVPEVLIAARAMHAAMDVLRPSLAESGVEPAGKIVMGTVAGDLHDIGKNLVLMMLEGGGFEVVDAGIDVPAEKFVEIVKTEQPDLLGMSALLTTTMPAMKKAIAALVEAGVRDQVKIMIGGAPVTQDFADEIDADGYAPDAASAVDLARSLIGTA
jgi:5-methyltetrahydrofolate--homocysteine methyltransferase